MLSRRLSHKGETNSLDPSWARVANFLRSSAAFPSDQAPRVIETHSSLVFLGETVVYKLKKPVRFDFLDFSTVKKRHQACKQEVLLNRRLAPDVYLGSVPVTINGSGSLTIDGIGQPIEWIVKMRRLPHERMLDALIERGNTKSLDMNALTFVLAQFYRNAKPVPISVGHFLQHMMDHIRSNRLELLRPDHRLPVALIKRVHGRQLQFVNLERNLFEVRLKNNRVIDGHGDLRPEHICMEDPPIIFDCIEFNKEFRQVDVADELCFLAMECERMNAKKVGDEILKSYSQVTADQLPQSLTDFYKSYRACVRAKVATLRSLQPGAKEEETVILAKSYLQLADRSFGATSQPLCVMVRGLVGSGKSTIATNLAQALGMEILQSDSIRREMMTESRQSGVYGTGCYTSQNRVEVYERMFELASVLICERISVILDACFIAQDLQHRVRALTETMGIELLIINCHCPDAVAIGRIVARSREPGCLSDALPEHLISQKRDNEGVLYGASSLSIDTSVGTTASHVRLIMRHIRRLLKGTTAPEIEHQVSNVHITSDIMLPDPG